MQSHGKVIFEWQDDLLIVKPIGPFYEEGAIDVIETLKSSILSKKINAWSQLEIWEEDTLGSPFVMTSVKDFFIWCTEQGCRATAVIVKNSVQSELIERHYIGEIAVFRNESKAIEWLTKNSDTQR